MENIKMRPYRVLSDFGAVHNFLTDTYSLRELNGICLPQFFEYAHTHPYFNWQRTHRMAIWEDNGKIVAFAGYEMDIGEALLVAGRGYEKLFPELLALAEDRIAAYSESGTRSLTVSTMNTQSTLTDLLSTRGYITIHTEPIRIFHYYRGFRDVKLPEGFTCRPLGRDFDQVKLNRCTWRGFDHGDIVEYDIDGIWSMLNSPNCRPDLGRIIVAPDGEYVCLAGMWYDEKNRYAYLEPLCTVPEYRRMGLAAYALTDAMRVTEALGAEYCFGGVGDFYTAMNFEKVCDRVIWRKEWKN